MSNPSLCATCEGTRRLSCDCGEPSHPHFKGCTVCKGIGIRREVLAGILDDSLAVVPREPTDAMLAVGKKAYRRMACTRYWGDIEAEREWRLMIAAAEDKPDD